MANRELRKFNLSKAQKYLDKLKTSISVPTQTSVRRGRQTCNYNNPTNKYYISVNEINNLISSEQELINNYNKLVKESIDVVETKMIIMKDYKNFKNKVYTLNAKSGLSDVLTQIDLLQEEKNIYDQIKSNMENITYLSETKLGELYNKVKATTEKSYYSSSNEFVDLKLKIFNLDELKEKLKKINIELEELETKRDQLNAGSIIEFNFHQKTLDLLGI
jgi:hypothetical protein